MLRLWRAYSVHTVFTLLTLLWHGLASVPCAQCHGRVFTDLGQCKVPVLALILREECCCFFGEQITPDGLPACFACLACFVYLRSAYCPSVIHGLGLAVAAMASVCVLVGSREGANMDGWKMKVKGRRN